MAFLKGKNAAGKPDKGVSTDPAAVKEILTRAVEDVFIKESLEKKLLSGKRLRIKLGIDPTSPHIHLGRAIPLRKLRAFQDLGHQAVLIIGDFTTQIGDPSDKLEKRPMLTPEKIRENLRDYKEKLAKIVDLKKAEFVYNSDWLKKLRFQEIAMLAESFSVQQMSARRNFKDRFDRGEEVSLREFLYPLMQGYDSVAVKADIEIGGFDQLFNLKAGRVIQKYYGQPEQDVMTFQMLEGTDGRKMSSSWGNVISITDAPEDMFGKIMAVRDELIGKYFLLCTDYPTEWIADVEARMKSGALNPRDAKADLARAVVALYHGAQAAERAAAAFAAVFQKGAIPDDIEAVEAARGAALIDVSLSAGAVKSKTEFRTLIEGGAITDMTSGAKIESPSHKVQSTTVFKIGKRRFLKVVVD